jgi:hypothetical protein
MMSRRLAAEVLNLVGKTADLVETALGTAKRSEWLANDARTLIANWRAEESAQVFDSSERRMGADRDLRLKCVELAPGRDIERAREIYGFVIGDEADRGTAPSGGAAA